MIAMFFVRYPIRIFAMKVEGSLPQSLVYATGQPTLRCPFPVGRKPNFGPLPYYIPELGPAHISVGEKE